MGKCTSIYASKKSDCGCGCGTTCGTLVEVIQGESCGCELTYNGTAMEKIEAKTADASTEKHVPVIEKIPGGFRITVGSTLHPMTEEHHIEWIEICDDSRVYRAYLKPGQQPVAEFQLDAESVCVREHCNIHGLWKNETT